MIVGLFEYQHRIAKCQLKVSRLHLAMSKVMRQLETPLDIVRIFLFDASALKLN